MAKRNTVNSTAPTNTSASPIGPITKEMTLDFDGLMGILANSLYSEKKVFIRELVQNGHDGIRRRESMQPDHHGRIDIDTRPDEGWISFADNGIGMRAKDLTEYLSRIGASGTKQIGKGQENVTGLVGQFGIGFLSGFIVADRVEVRTRSVHDDRGWLWQNKGGKDYTLEPCDIEQSGTAVKVFIKDASDKFLLESDEVIAVVREYCDMLRVPIHVNRSTVAANTQVMPWERDGISDDERDLDCKIYLAKNIRGDSLIETFSVRIESPFRAGGILYVSKRRTYGVRVPRNLRIYQDRMFVTNDPELLPPWAEFVSGIVETSGLTPNAARDGFIKNAAWSQLRDALGDLIIRGMDKLRETNRKQLSYILKFHDLGIKAACYHHEPFFKNFAHLLEWRVNRLPGSSSDGDAEDMLEMDVPGGSAFHWRTLPEVLDATAGEPGRPKRLLTFTTTNAANQYFDIANAKNVHVVDASFPFEDELIAGYVKLPDAPPIDLVYVDRHSGKLGGLFDDLQSGDQHIRKLADFMSQFIHPGGVGKLKVEASRFEPSSLSAVLLNAARGKAELEARRILADPTQSSNLREMAEELLRNARAANAMRMTINASCPFIQNLARQDFRDARVQHIMLGVFNSAILYNAEILTANTAKVFHDQFGEFMESALEMIADRAAIERDRTAIEQERTALQVASGINDQKAGHGIVFLMTPFNEEYADLEKALRMVIEDRFGCQLCLARDQVLHPELRANVEAHMRQAHAYLAEVSVANPNVMYEVGRARALYPSRPMIFLTHPHPSTGRIELPADLNGLLRLDYKKELSTISLTEHLERELRKAQSIIELLEHTGLDEFAPTSKLREWIRPLTLPNIALDALASKFPTTRSWRHADEKAVLDVVMTHGFDLDDAMSLLKKIKKSIGEQQETNVRRP